MTKHQAELGTVQFSVKFGLRAFAWFVDYSRTLNTSAQAVTVDRANNRWILDTTRELTRLTELAANVSLGIGFARAFKKRTGWTVFDHVAGPLAV